MKVTLKCTEKPRLRFDKVVVWLMNRLKTTLSESVPDGMTLLVTVTAPIRLASKTAAEIEERARKLLTRASTRDVRETIHGNDIRIRLVKHESKRAPKMFGFVHNPETDPLPLLNMSRDLLAPMKGGARDLVISVDDTSCLEACRYICSELNVAAKFKKILFEFSDGRVEEFI